MGTRFDACYAVTSANEGGYVNRREDKGGETNRGVTWPTLKRAISDGVLPAGTTIRGLTEPQAKVIYRKYYWDASRAAELPAPLDMAFYDSFVNHRPQTAVKLLQRALGITEDAVIGPQTLHEARLHAAVLGGVIDRALSARAQYYFALTVQDESQEEFINGWLIRLFALKAATLAEVA